MQNVSVELTIFDCIYITDANVNNIRLTHLTRPESCINWDNCLFSIWNMGNGVYRHRYTNPGYFKHIWDTELHVRTLSVVMCTLKFCYVWLWSWLGVHLLLRWDLMLMDNLYDNYIKKVIFYSAFLEYENLPICNNWQQHFLLSDTCLLN